MNVKESLGTRIMSIIVFIIIGAIAIYVDIKTVTDPQIQKMFIWLIVMSVSLYSIFRSFDYIHCYGKIKNKTSEWFEKIYIRQGIDLLIQKVDRLYFLYSTFISGNEPEQSIDRENITTEFTNAISKVAALFGDHYVFQRVYSKLYGHQFHLKESSEKDRKYYVMCKNLKFFLYDTKNELLKLQIKKKSDVQAINLSNDLKFIDNQGDRWVELEEFSH